MIKVNQRGSWANTYKFLNQDPNERIVSIMDKYGRKGVEALSLATPVSTGKTSRSWNYVIEEEEDRVSLTWTNSNTSGGLYIALMIQYGHGTKNGGYIAGVDYINPALNPIFKQIADDAWTEVNR